MLVFRSVARTAPLALLLVPAVVLAQAPSAAPAPPPAAAAAPAANPAAPPAAAPAPGSLAAILAEVDAAWAVRDQPGKMDAVLALLKTAEKQGPTDYEFLWRMARYYYWLADDPSITNEEKARLGKLTWEWSDKANQANPARVEGWFYGSAGVGMYSLGISIVKALLDGMESKYLDRLRKAQAADASYYGYGGDVSWGRYYYEVPWPKYDGEKSEIFYRKALRGAPHNLRAKVYLAELYLKEDHPVEAKKLLDAVLAAVPGAYDPPEERRAQGLARAVAEKTK
ncbi:MAG TPA: tetratricopeptide repeat protein [Anaeromyxobacteraceae bacterium]|nr:tetratricopeptide repeat protein [Anaeromyxobacteraceae bacterium]